MIDDMSGLYDFTSEAYRAGKVAGRSEFYDAVMLQLSTLSVKHEKAGDVSAFHAAEEACRLLREAKERSDAPKHAI